MCPVGDRPLLDWSLDALAPAVEDIAVNVHHMAGQIIEVLRWWTDADVPGEPRLPLVDVVAQLRTVANIGRFDPRDPRRQPATEEPST